MLVRETEPAVWLLEETFPGLDGGTRTRRGLVARVELLPVLERPGRFPTSAPSSDRRTRAWSFCAPRGRSSRPSFSSTRAPRRRLPMRAPDMEATLDGVTSRLWRMRATTRSRRRSAASTGACSSPTATIATRRRSPSTRRREREETGYVLAALVSRERRRAGDPAHAPARLRRAARARRLLSAHRHRAERRSRHRGAGGARRATIPRSSSFAGLGAARRGERRGRARHGGDRPPAARGVRYTPSADAAEEAVRGGRADAAFLVRAPTLDQVDCRRPWRASCCRRRRPTSSQADERPRLLSVRRMTDWLGLRPADRRRPGRRPRRAPHEARAGARGRRWAKEGTRRPPSTPLPSAPSSRAWRSLPRPASSSRSSPRSSASGRSARTTPRLVLDPIDGSMNAKRGVPFFSVSLAVAEGPTMADVFFGYVFDFGTREEWTAQSRRGSLPERRAARWPRAEGGRGDALLRGDD